MGIYEKANLKRQSFFQKILCIHPKQNYIAELQNLLCEYENCFSSLDFLHIHRLKKKYRIKKGDFLREREQLLETYIIYCTWDNQFSEEEQTQLQALSHILDISEEQLHAKMIKSL
ncbi:MAG: hypothetical protein SPE30_10275 [Candidatus Treponema excrementipullorum]|nr:hypothetical protein [Candidatus Treponema excrementipullorum]